MYQEYFGLTEKPFAETPNTRFFYLSNRHREGLAHLEYNILDGKGFTVLTGEVGTGKTTLCKALIERLDKEKHIVAHVIHTNLDFHEFLREVTDELGISAPGQQKWDLLKALNQFLIEAYGQNRKVILIVDEAQNLTPQVLEGIRMLSNLETSQDKLIQIVFAGQPGLMEHIQRPDMLQLKQRIAGSFFLGPLSKKETQEYITFRLNTVQARPSLRFTSEACDLVHELSGGIPRLINFLCDFSLIQAYVSGSWTVDHILVRQGYKDLKGERSEEDQEMGEKDLSGKFKKSAGLARAGTISPPRKVVQVSEVEIREPEAEEDFNSGRENFFFPKKRFHGKKIALALGLFVTLGGLGSLVFWEMNLERSNSQAVLPGYQIKMPVTDLGTDLQSRLVLPDQKLTKMESDKGPGE